MAKHGKRLKRRSSGLDRDRLYPLDEAVEAVKAHATAKFDETVEIALNLGVDPRHADQMVRGTVNLPHGTGKTLRVAVFARGDKADEARGRRRRHRRRRGPGRARSRAARSTSTAASPRPT